MIRSLGIISILLGLATGCQGMTEQKRDASETQEIYLSGTGAEDTVDWEFFCTDGRNSGEWGTIAVPSCWEQQGYGTYNYGQNSPNPGSEQGKYRTSFNVPSDWEDQNVQIVFEGSMTDTEVKINGKSAGPIHQGAFYQFRYDITELLNIGEENLLEVTVSKRSSNASVNRAEREADFWIFGGIYRPVLLEVRPEESLQRVAIAAEADGDFSVFVYPNEITEALQLEARVEDTEGKMVGSPITERIRPQDESVKLSKKFSGVTPWTMEAPALYSLVVELKQGGKTLHTVRERFGFRSVEVKEGDGLYLNGTRIRVKGVNRHVFHPDYARTSSRALSEEAVELIKGMNMNAIRMSHYPPDSHLLDVCDEEGLLVVDELTGWQTEYDTDVARKLVKEMVVRDVNHPSVIIWANGNENGWNGDVDEDFFLHDPQNRPLIHPVPEWGPKDGVVALGGLDTSHYQPYDAVVNKLNGPNLFMPTEFLHGLYDGGHGAGLRDYWDAMYNSPYGVGGFLWVFADEGVARTDRGGRIDNWINKAPDGLVGPRNEKESSYFTVRNIWSPVLLEDPEISSSWDGKIQVFNDYYFTDLNQCAVRWELGNFPTISDSESDLQVTEKGAFRAPSVDPQKGGTLQLPLPDGWYKNDALRVTVFNGEKRPLRQWTWSFRSKGQVAAANLPEAPESPAMYSDDSGSITLMGGDVQVTISKDTGRISQVLNNNIPIEFNNGPRLANGKSELRKVRVSESDTGPVVTADYSGGLKKVTYQMRGDGWMRIDYELDLSGQQPNIGITFDYPADKVKRFRWMGNGPYPVWKNRLEGPMLGVWEKDANDPIPGETYTNDPVFRGYHSDFRWGEIFTSEGCIKMVSGAPDMFLHLLDPTNGRDPMKTQYVMPEGDISFLHAISPVGTKFKDAHLLGPMSQPNIAEGEYTGSLWLGFGSDQ